MRDSEERQDIFNESSEDTHFNNQRNLFDKFPKVSDYLNDKFKIFMDE